MQQIEPVDTSKGSLHIFHISHLLHFRHLSLTIALVFFDPLTRSWRLMSMHGVCECARMDKLENDVYMCEF